MHKTHSNQSSKQIFLTLYAFSGNFPLSLCVRAVTMEFIIRNPYTIHMCSFWKMEVHKYIVISKEINIVCNMCKSCHYQFFCHCINSVIEMYYDVMVITIFCALFWEIEEHKLGSSEVISNNYKLYNVIY